MPKTYNASEAADVLGTTQPTISAWIKDGRLPADRVVTKRGGRPAWSIKHDDLMLAAQGSQFSMKESPATATMLFDDPDSMTRDAMSLKVWWPMKERSEPFSLELLTGYSRFRAVTYSVSIPMVYKLLMEADYDEFQVVFGDEKLVKGDMRAANEDLTADELEALVKHYPPAAAADTFFGRA